MSVTLRLMDKSDLNDVLEISTLSLKESWSLDSFSKELTNPLAKYIVAKNEETHEKLSKMIGNKEVERRYLAITTGVIKTDTGTIDAPIGRDQRNRLKMQVTDVNAKEAITHFKVLKRYKANTLIECILETGRTHQIRVHLAYINYPIVNDPLYGKEKNCTEFGQMLHSKSIRFNHPRTNKELYFEVEPPKEFKEKLEELENEE